MYKSSSQFILAVLLGCGLMGFVAQAADEPVLEINEIVEQDILPNMRIAAVQNGQEINSTGEDGSVHVQTVDYIGLDSLREQDKTYIVFSGSNAPDNVVISVSFPNDDLVRSTTSTDGEWKIAIPVDLLSPGEQGAYVSTKQATMQSADHQVAEFMINSNQSISDTTWLFMFSTVVAIVCLLLAVTLQLRHNMLGFGPDPVR